MLTDSRFGAGEASVAARNSSSSSSAEASGLGGVAPATFFSVGRVLSRYAWPRDDPVLRRRVLISVGLLLGSKVILVQVPLLFKLAVDALAPVHAAAGTVAASAATWPIVLLVGYGLARGCASLTNELRNAIFSTVSQRAISDLALTTFRRILSLDLSFHASRQTGALARTIDRGMRGIDFLLRALVFNILPTALEVGLVCGLLAYSCGSQYASVAAATLSAYALFTFGMTQWRTQFRKNMNMAENAASNKAVDSLLNYETVKYFNNEQLEASQYATFLERYGRENVKTQVSLSALNFGQNAIFSVALAAMMIMSAREVIAGSMSVGDVVFVNGLLFQMSMPLNFLGSVYREVRQSLTDMEMMFGVMELRPRIAEPSSPPPLPLFAERDATVEFRNVHFVYPDSAGTPRIADRDDPLAAGQAVLRDVSFVVPHGKKLALVGPSGCGKSTIFKLLYRFYDPTAGSIHIGGRDIRQVSVDSLRRAIACIPQDVVLFNDTLGYNIRYGRFDATSEQVEAAARAAYIHETVVKRFPDGYNTLVGERGIRLSGGEKQRIAIARAILKNAPILLSDEMSSALDASTERSVRAAMRRVSATRTTLFAAHRLASIADADEILVLQQGAVVERGTHEQLLGTADSLYRSLWRAQQVDGAGVTPSVAVGSS